MKKTRVLLIMVVLGGTFLASSRSLPSYMQPPPPPDAGGCDMQFLFSELKPTIDGQITGNEWNDAGVIESTGCIDPLLDGPPNADGTYSSNLQQGPVTIFTKRDNQNLYFAFTVTDATIVTPNNANGQALTLGDRIILQFDPNHSRESVPKPDDFRVELVLYRNATAQVDVVWYQGSGNTTNPWNVVMKNPPFVQAKCLSNAAGSSYVAEVQVLFGPGGLGYTLNPGKPADMGIAVAVVNDLDGWLPSDPTTEAATGTAFPNLSYMKVIDNNDIIVDPADQVPLQAATPWDTPSNWGTAFLAGAGDEISIDRTPAFWISDDIKALFCRVTAASDPPTPMDFYNAPSRNTPGWYRYDNTLTKPCPLYLMVQIRRTGGVTDPNNPGAAAVKKRVLSLWAQNGANPINWTTINLTGPIALLPGTNQAQQEPGQPSNQYIAVTDVNWANVPAKETVGHPCVRVFILPEVLNLANTDPDSQAAFPTLNEAFFNSLGSEVATATKTADQLNLQKFNTFVTAYGIPDSQVAQMNLDWLQFPTGQSCPDCPAIAPRRGGEPRGTPLSTRPGPARAETVRAPAARIIQTRRQNPVPGPAAVKQGTVVEANFIAYGYPRTRRHRKYTFIETLGGVQEAVDLSHLKDKGIVEVRFNVSNGNEYVREIFLSSKLSVPGGEKGIGLRVGDCEPVFRPAETKTIVAAIGPKVTSPPWKSPPPPGKPLPPPGKPLPATGGTSSGR